MFITMLMVAKVIEFPLWLATSVPTQLFFTIMEIKKCGIHMEWPFFSHQISIQMNTFGRFWADK